MTGRLGLRKRRGDESVARPDALLAVEHQQRGVGVGQLLLHAPGHARGQRVARALHAGQVDEHHLALAARADAADRAARGLRAIGDDRDLVFDDRVDERRLADVRPARERDEAAARQRVLLCEQLALQREHLAVVGLVVHADEVQHPVDDRLAHVGGVLRADDHVAELARSPPIGSAPSIGKDSTSVGLRLARCSRVQLGDARSVDELDRHVPVAAPRPCRGERAQTADLRSVGRPPEPAAPRRRASAPKTSTSIIARAQARRSAERSPGASRWECTS